MTPPRLLIAIAMVSVFAAAPAHGDKGRTRTVKVRVVEVAGGRAYLEPGSDAGLRVGQRVRIGKRRLRIAAVTRSHAVVELGTARIREGARGSVRVSKRRKRGKLPAPTPLDRFRGQWPVAVRPATQQRPDAVSIGVTGGTGSVGVTVYGGGAAWFPARAGATNVVRVSGGVRVRAEPWSEAPFGFDADVGASRWAGGGLDDDLGADARPNIRVRELRLRYGDRRAPLAALGRLRYAATTIGLLDGARLSTPPLRNFRIAAFGGYVPHAQGGGIETDAARFGAEVTYHAPDARWRPYVSLVAHGSRFAGALDERRLTGYARLHPGLLSVLAHAEASGFDKDNPWGARRFELTSAGIDVSARSRRLHVGVRLSARQPERSHWLSSLVPQSWLCTAKEQPPSDPLVVEPCSGRRDVRLHGAVDAGVRYGRYRLSAGATSTGKRGGDRLEEVGAFADLRVVRLHRDARLHLGAIATRGTFVDTAAVRVSVGAPIRGDVDLSLFYRPALLAYRAALETWAEHRFGVDALYAPLPRLSVGLTVEGATGRDTAGVGMFATAIWRPRL